MTLYELMNKTKCAVIAVDIQNDYCHPEGACAKRGCDVSGAPLIIPHVNKLIDTAHKNDIPVIFIQTIHTDETDSKSWSGRNDGKSKGTVCRPGTWEMKFYEVSPSENDIIVNKHRYSAFIHTRLESVLHTLNVETIIVCGVATNVCVESTARDGYMLDYNVILVSDCCAAFSSKAHDMTLENISQNFGTVAKEMEIEDSLLVAAV